MLWKSGFAFFVLNINLHAATRRKKFMENVMATSRNKNRDSSSFKLVIPISTSDVDDVTAGKSVKILALDRDGSYEVDVVKMDSKGKGKASLTFSEKPTALRVLLGPENASDDDLQRMQTLEFNLSSRQIGTSKQLDLEQIKINSYYWHWWLRWCREFTVRGVLRCPDGNPVPGAKVCAFDVDAFWWWSSTQSVGCATTDATGSFEIKFRWCCGWWPLWWWFGRVWRVEPKLAEHILPRLQKDLKIPRPPIPDPRPDFSIFEDILNADIDVPNVVDGNFSDDRIGLLKAATQKMAVSRSVRDKHTVSLLDAEMSQVVSDELSQLSLASQNKFNASEVEILGRRLRAGISTIAELDHLKIWPWYPWHPWWDCSPDIIFRATQICEGTEKVIVDESLSDARWNIPTSLNVTLVAEDACCVDPTPQPEGNCLNITHVCNNPVASIGGNLSAPATPAGYLSPGIASIWGDRPYGGVVRIRGDFGTLSDAHYYELEWFDNATASWKEMPVGSIAGFQRAYYGPGLPAGPIDTWQVLFDVKFLDGRHVIETRQHFEDNNGSGTWEMLVPGSRWWMNNKDLLAVWRTEGHFPDGTYHLRVKSWKLAGGNLVNPKILGQCGASPVQDNHLILTIDNRIVGSGSGHPTSTDHPCVGVHKCTTEPDTDIIDVKILHDDGSSATVGACGGAQINLTDLLQVDFLAHDPDNHLSYYTLVAHWGENNAHSLLGLAGAVLTPSPVAAPVPTAAQVGPRYSNALAQGAVSPFWAGGAIRLTVPAHLAFPDTCCYQLRLIAHKRTVYNCNHSLWNHVNTSEYGFLINT